MRIHVCEDFEPSTGKINECFEIAVLPATVDVLLECSRQDQKWGGPEHDDNHAPNDWLRFIQDRCEYQSYALRFPERYAQENNPYADDYRGCLVKVAALAVAGIESYDRFLAKSPKAQD